MNGGFDGQNGQKNGQNGQEVMTLTLTLTNLKLNVLVTPLSKIVIPQSSKTNSSTA